MLKLIVSSSVEDDPVPHSIVVKNVEDDSWPEVVEAFVQALQGCGYSYLTTAQVGEHFYEGAKE